MPPTSPLVNRIKVQLKLSVSRLRMVQQKDTALAKQQRRQMAQLLEQGREESARIRVENIIRSDLNTELLEVIELYCELLSARVGLLEAKECDPGLEEAVKSIIYAAPRIEGVKELNLVRGLLVEKFGKEFALKAAENADGKVATRVTDRLKIEPPSKELVEGYLSTIADAYDIDYPKGIKARRQAEADAVVESARIQANSSDDKDEDDKPSGGEKIRALQTPLAAEEGRPQAPSRKTEDAQGIDVARSSDKQPDPTTKTTTTVPQKDTGIPDLDDLARRFAALKKGV